MQISCNTRIDPITQDAFQKIDYEVMRHAFDLHNEFGRFFDEKIYQEELAERCRSTGLNCETEVEIRITYKTFSKVYYLDLLVEHGAVYELKTAETLNSNYEAQLINYLLINRLQYGKLVNFRPASVQHRFISTTLTDSDRFNYTWNSVATPSPPSESGQHFIQQLKDLLDEWGAFLDVTLYRDAILELTSGEYSGVKPVDIITGTRTVGTQNMCLLNPSEAWHLSSVRTAHSAYEEHLARKFRHTAVETLYWVNMDHRNITLKIIK
jgi:GxxExxY protein